MSENSSFLKELAEVAPAPRIPGPVEDLTGFNVEYGFLEAHLRGTSLCLLFHWAALLSNVVSTGDWVTLICFRVIFLCPVFVILLHNSDPYYATTHCHIIYCFYLTTLSSSPIIPLLVATSLFRSTTP